MGDLLDEWEKNGTSDPRHLAYMLATDFHETGSKMQPVREGFKKTDKEARRVVARRKYGKPEGPWGHVYYGRGDIQLTWFDNYVRMGKILGLPLAEKPDLVLKSKVSKAILVEGMLDGASKDGDFTGKSLQDYFNETTDDAVGARRIVNGTDKARLIASYHAEFLEAVEAALSEPLAADEADEQPARLPKANDPITWGGALATLGGLGSAISATTERMGGPATFIAIGVIGIGAVLLVRGRNALLKETGE